MSPIQLQIWQIIYSFSALHGFFITVILLFNKKSNKKPNRILGLLVLCISLILTKNALILLGVFEEWPHLMFATFPLWFIVGPLFYYYFKSLITGIGVFKWTDLLHFVPLLICISLIGPFYILSADQKLNILNGSVIGRIPSYQLTFLLYLYSVQTVIYIIVSLKLIKRYEIKVKELSSDTKVISVVWLRTLVKILVVFLLIDFVIGTSMFISNNNNDNYSYASIIIISSFIYIIAYNIIMHPNRIFSTYSTSHSAIQMNFKYKNSSMEESEIELIKLKLAEIMENEKLFLNEELRLSELAENLGITSHQLSQVINQYFNQNFYNYVNTYRIREVQKRLTAPDYQNYTILAIALDTGFNSNASFYRAFKLHTGQTPSQYLKSHSRVYNKTA
jgi:AraC-like DNA-binding protein